MNSEEYIEALQKEITEKKANGIKGLYRISEHVSDETVRHVRLFLERDGYGFEIKKCKRCTNVWDIIIYF